MAEWADLDFNNALFENASDTIMSNATVALENCYQNEGGGFSRFPGSKPFVTGLPGAKTFMDDWRNDIIAVTDSGRFYRVDKNGLATDVTGVPLSGGKRPTFAKTEDQMVAAAGGKVLQMTGGTTFNLAAGVPEATHVAFVDGYLVVGEKLSARFYHNSPAGFYEQWDPIDVFTADAKPDDVNAIVVTPYRELLCAGIDSIEQYERLQAADVAFQRRWSTGEGVFAPYTLLAAKTGNYGVNKQREFVRFSGQVSRPTSDDISFALEKIDNWEDAWAKEVYIKGQKFIVLSIPNATNPYGTTGQTFLLDIRKRRFSRLYSWDDVNGTPAGWRATSYHSLWGRHFIGVRGGIEELDPEVFSENGGIQRILYRTAHISKWTRSRIDQLELRFVRGVDSYTSDPQARVNVRINRDNKGFKRPLSRFFGRPGEREMTIRLGNLGIADTWQFEIEVSDPVAVDFVQGRVYVERIRR